MEPEGISVSVCAAALRAVRDPFVEGRCCRVMVYFLLSCFCDWICKPGTEQHRRGQSVGLRQCHINQDSLRSHTKARNRNTRIRCEKRGHKTSARGLAICLGGREGDTKNSPGLGYSPSDEAARHCGCDFRLKHSNGGASLNAADVRAARTGLNLHLILVILFSTNKLTPEKT